MEACTHTLFRANPVAAARVLRTARALDGASFPSETGETDAAAVLLTIAVQTARIFTAAFALERAIDAGETRKTTAGAVDARTEI